MVEKMVVSIDGRLEKLEQTCSMMKDSITDMKTIMEKMTTAASREIGEAKIVKVK